MNSGENRRLETAEEATDEASLAPASPEIVQRLLAGRRDFLRFLERRMPEGAAEELLQAAFVRTLERGGAIRDAESAVAWFYRLLRNAMVDYYRKRGTEAEAQEAAGVTEEAEGEIPPDAKNAICGCMKTLLPTLKPEYAEMVERVDLAEQPLGNVAADLAISVNNATVRLHRARQALKRQLERSCGACATHGCLDCTCKHG